MFSGFRYTAGMSTLSTFEDDFPYPSQRMPVYARNAVATSQPLAAQAGLRIMRQGGNAIDAAIATAAVLTVVEPTSNGLGSDAFAFIWAGGGLHGLNASGRSPAAFSADHLAGRRSFPYYGWDGVTVPGAVSAWALLSERFGALPFAQLMQPAIEYASDGFPVSPMTASSWQRAAEIYRPDQFPAWHEHFAPDGRAPSTGEIFRSPDQARTLERIADSRGADFYEGELADRMAKAAEQAGATLRSNDLAQHAPEWVRPLNVTWRDVTLNEIPPNGQGIAALIALGIMRAFDVEDLDPDGVEALHLQIEAMKLAFADAHRYVADPEFMDVDPAHLIDPSYLRSRASRVRRDRAQDFDHGEPKPGGTVYLTTADQHGNMVSFIQSNYTGFGSGIVIPGTGIAMQNRGACFSLEPGHPNEAGPGKRPYHTIIPGFITREDADGGIAPLTSFGVMGGFMQPQGHLQVLLRMFAWRQNPQAALDAPRWRVNRGLSVTLEPGFAPEVIDGLRELGHDLTLASARTVSHGRGQIIHRIGNENDSVRWLAASDLRSDGQSVGF
ncbi:MAG: gamma-glutamyltransferase family protein [Planctomycetota bacterium]